jgi:hypothetical protein
MQQVFELKFFSNWRQLFSWLAKLKAADWKGYRLSVRNALFQLASKFRFSKAKVNHTKYISERLYFG